MLKSTSALGSDRATMDIILMDTIIRTTTTTTDPTSATLTIGLTIGMATTDITATIVIIDTITGTKLTEKLKRLAGTGAIPSQQRFTTEIARTPETGKCERYFFELGDSGGLTAGLLPGWSIWNSLFSC